MKQETKNLLIKAKSEIVSLRRQNEILSAKVGVMELFECVIFTRPSQPTRVEAVDVVWEIEKELTTIDA
jgi:hypothetical protein